MQSVQMVRALLGQIAIIDMDEAAANSFGSMKAQLRRQGLLIADFDLLIAAATIVAGRTLVTNNARHFQRLAAFGLVIENWVS